MRDMWVPLFCTLLGRISFTGGHQLTSEEKHTIVELHNHYRSQVMPTAANMRNLSWNTSLESVAKDYAVQCIWDHNPNLEDTGENLYITSGALNISKALTSWYEEHHSFTYKNNSCVEEQMCGHYTQVVWADTDTIGCASHTCDTVKGISLHHTVILVCNYFPRGNYEDEFPYQEGKPCTQCPDKIQKCKNNICGEDGSTMEVDPINESPVTEVAQTRIYLDRQQTPYVAYTGEDGSTMEVDPINESPVTEVAQTRIYLYRPQASYGAVMTTAWLTVFVTTLLSFVLCLDSAT
ncbi:peptidase inhibitor 16-like isoform X2 [Brienomyrus brachyistius]|uniref:peptidase inhibitor 16-like isoform X2 n=1 Tax=Brienomyrus brachyistius TaxID=42636 RepID=UPI0020B23F4E|nr:peptidase inhibitor 16-like isoform X2 [Brienomyrus brachyistius]